MIVQFNMTFASLGHFSKNSRCGNRTSDLFYLLAISVNVVISRRLQIYHPFIRFILLVVISLEKGGLGYNPEKHRFRPQLEHSLHLR